jgi:chromosomal replication initiation ATPase DnaA
MSNTPSQLWTQISQHIRERVSSDGFERWFSNVTVGSVEDSTLRLTVPNPIHQFFIESNYLPIVKESILFVFPGVVNVEFIAGDHAPESPVRNSSGSPRKSASAKDKSPQIAITQQVFSQASRYNELLLAPYCLVSNGMEIYLCKMDFESTLKKSK